MYKIGFNLGLSKGGPSIFIDRLKKSLTKLKLNKISYFFDPLIDVYLCINRKFYNPWDKPMVFRLDGVPHKRFLISKKFDKNTKLFYKQLNKSSGIIYQSNFCKLITKKFFHLNSKIPNTIIYNGVDIKLFKKKGQNLRKFLGINSNDLVFICSANFRSKNKRLKAIISAFEKFKTKNKIKKYLIILGSISKKIGINKKMLQSKYIITPGKVNVSNLPKWYRTGDVFLHFTYVDFCPNSVIEAIATKLPILCTNLGGTKELVQITNSGIVVKADKDINLDKIDMWNPPEPNLKLILKYMYKIVEDKKFISNQINLNSINIYKVSRQYSRFINKIKI